MARLESHGEAAGPEGRDGGGGGHDVQELHLAEGLALADLEEGDVLPGDGHAALEDEIDPVVGLALADEDGAGGAVHGLEEGAEAVYVPWLEGSEEGVSLEGRGIDHRATVPRRAGGGKGKPMPFFASRAAPDYARRRRLPCSSASPWKKAPWPPPSAGRRPSWSSRSPDSDERKLLTGEYGIDEHDLASALDPDELGRIESRGEHVVAILKRPCNFTGEDQLLFTVASMGLFFTKRRLVVVATDGLGLFQDRAVRHVANVKDVILKILYGTIAHFLGHLKVINMLSEALEGRISASMENRYLLDMFTLEKSLVYFVNGIGSNQAVLEKMRGAGEKLGFTEDQAEILDEIIIENRQCSKQAEIYSDILTGLMDARFSVINNNLSVLMKRLTVISIIFMPMNLLAGIGGMSEFSTWTQGAPRWLSYGLFILGLVPLGFLTSWVLDRTGRGEGRREARRHERLLRKVKAFR